MKAEMKVLVRLALAVLGAALLFAGALAWLGAWSGGHTALAQGATRYVDAAGGCGGHTPCYTTVQAAVDAASVGDVIRVAAGTYTGVSAREGVTQVVYLSKTVTIQGGYTTAYADPPDPVANPTVLSALGQGRVVYIAGSITPTLAGLRLTGGNATGLGGYYDPDTGQMYDGGGAVYSAYATPTITNCQIDNSGAQAGGGIALFQSPLRLYNSSVLTNQAGYGGGLAIGRSAAIVQNNLFAGNQAGYGGALGAGQSAAQILSNTIRANTVVSSGGGIALIGNPAATVQGNVIVSNTARWGGGVVISSSAALVANNIITGNRANEVGGGVNLDHCNATIASNLIQGNDAGYGGGGFYCVADTAVVTGNQVLSNTSSLRGGGLYLNESAAQVVNNTIAGNTAAGTATDEAGGGGVYLRRTTGATLRGNAILANAAHVYGGGVYIYQGAVTLENNTIATNTLNAQSTWDGGGGGVYVRQSNAATLTGNTIAANRAFGAQDVRGGGVYLGSSATLTANRILSNSVESSGSGSAYGGGIYVDTNVAPTLSQNEVFSNTTQSDGQESGGGLYVAGGGGGQIVNNTFAFNRSEWSGGIYLEHSAATLAGNRIIANRAAFYGGGLYVNYGVNVIERNTFLSNTADIVGGGLALYEARNNRVVNNVIAANSASGSNWFCYGGGAGIAVNYPGPALMHNTIVSNTGSPGVCFRGRSAEATLPMTNTIIAGHATGVHVYDGQALLESTLWHNNTSNYSGNVTDNHPLTGDPDFLDAAAHDYHIGAASAALDVGADSGVADDMDGDSRPADGGYDVGADERPGVALRILKTAAPMAVNPGGWMTYTVIVSSVGAANASGVVLTDTLPLETRVQNVQASQGTCAHGSGWGAQVLCALGTLNSGTRAVVTLTVETTTTVPTVMPARLRNIAQTRASGTLTMMAQADAWLQDCHARLNNDPTDYPTVQAAVDAATQSSDVVKVAGTCVGVNTLGGLRQQVYLLKTLTIRGGYTTGDWNTSDPTAHPTTLDALGLGRVVSVIGTISPTLEGLTLQNGDATGLGGYTHPFGGWTEDAGGGIAIVNAGATVTNCRVYSSTATYGGGLFAGGGAAQIVNNTLAGNSGTSGGGLHLANDSATATGNAIMNNTASGGGGGVFLNESAATLSGNTVTGNTANSGGGVYIEEGAPTLTGNAVTTNTARSGGGVYASSDRAVITGGNTIAGNTASTSSGGGLYHNNSHSAVTNNTIAHNVSNDDGGGAYFIYSEAQYTGNAFLNNSAGSNEGGGAYVDGDYYGGGPVNFIGNTFIGNSAWNGGGLRLLMGTCTISGNLMMSNTAAYGGGAYLQSMIYNYVPQLVQIIGNTAMSNTATQDGGGFYLLGPRPYLRNNILRGNTASDDGGGLYVRYQAYEQMLNTVIVDNSAGDSGGGVYLEGASPKMIHTTLARNASGAGRAVYAETYSGGYYSNPVFTNTILADSATGFYVEADNSAAVNGILWYNVGAQTGGSGLVTVTQSSIGDPAFGADGYHLASGSPAIDQGLNAGVTYDVDGQPRPMDWGYDLGADEFAGVVLEVIKRAPALYVVYRQPLTYTLLITSAGTLNATGVVITDTLNVWQQVSAVAASQGTCTVSAGWGGGAICSLGTLPSGATARITLTAQISPNVTLGQALTNTASARANETANSAQTLAYATDCRARINDGATEYTLLQDAVDAASPGDLIKVAGGTCIGLNTRGGYGQVVYLNKQVTIRGGYNADWTTTDPAGNPTFIHAQGGGRALYVTGGVNPTLENLRFTGGDAGSLGGAHWSGSGGGVCVNGAAPTLSNTHFLNNAGVRGAGLFLESSGALVVASRFYSNTASLRGGGAYVYQSTAAFEGNRLYANTAISTGGGVYVYQGTPVFNANLVTGNTSDYGGGVYLDTTSPRFYNTVIADNRAALKAGGLYVYASSPQLWHTTLARNVYTESTGVYVNNTSNVAMTNTILVSQSVGIEVVAGGAATLNGVLWYSNTTGNLSGTVTVQNATTGNPAFAADGYHLTAGSAAIDHGVTSGVATDIDGDARPQSGLYDLGADEYPGVAPVNYTLTIAKAGNGNGVVTPTVGTYTYLSGTLVVVTATAQADSTFIGWSGACSGTAPTCAVTMDANKQVTATFNLVGTCTPVSGVDFTFAPAAPVVGEPVWFTGTVAAGDPPLTYNWAWGDGTPNGSGATLSHTFPVTVTAQTYPVTLTVSNACPSQSSRTWPVVVQPRRIFLPLVLRAR